MADILSYPSLKEMKLAEFKKAFKEKSQWRKAKAAIFLIDYKLGSKKVPVAIPLRKVADLKSLVKEIKKDGHPNPKIAGGSVKIVKIKGETQVHFTRTQGGYDVNALSTKVSPLFTQLLKFEFSAQIGVEKVDQPTEQSNDSDALSSKESAPTSTTDNQKQTENSNNSQKKGDNSQKEGNSTENSSQTDASNNSLENILPIFNQIKGSLGGDVKSIIDRFRKKDNRMQDQFLLKDVAADMQTFFDSFKVLDKVGQKKMTAAKTKFVKYYKTIHQVKKQLSKIDIPPQSDEEIDQMIARIEKKAETLIQKAANTSD